MNKRAFSGMKWSVKRTNDCNGMKLYSGCISPTERRKRACEDEERTAEKNKVAYFLAALFFCAVKCLWNGVPPFAGRLEQPNGTKGTTAERPLDCP
jgi:hypothetical protein